MRCSLALLPLLLILTACSQKQAPLSNSRIAIVKFDDQSAMPDRWIANEIAFVLTDSLQSRKELLASIVEDSEGWRTFSAGRYISGRYYRTPRGIEIDAQLVNAANSAILKEFHETSKESELGSFIASRMIPALLGWEAPKPAVESTLRELAQAIEARDSSKLVEFARNHPEIEQAYPILAERLVREGKRDEANLLPVKVDPKSLAAAQLGLMLSATPQDRLTALVAMLAHRPGDVQILAAAARLASEIKAWDIAVEQLQHLTRLDPNNIEWWSGLGYAEANRNRLNEAIAAIEQYRRLQPNEPNVIDSFGEVHYMNRKFAEAARYFDEQSHLYPAFQSGAGPRKAAFAYYYAGDLKTADERFDLWLRTAVPPANRATARASWLARTKRLDAAMSLLKSEPPSPAVELRIAEFDFGSSGRRPSIDQVKRWNAGIQDPALRNEFLVFALLSQQAPNAAALKTRIEAATNQPQLQTLRAELSKAADEIFAPPVETRPVVFPLPPPAETALDAILLRQRTAVIP